MNWPHHACGRPSHVRALLVCFAAALLLLQPIISLSDALIEATNGDVVSSRVGGLEVASSPSSDSIA